MIMIRNILVEVHRVIAQWQEHLRLNILKHLRIKVLYLFTLLIDLVSIDQFVTPVVNPQAIKVR